MHRPIFGHSFVVLVAPVLLSVLAFNFLNKKKNSARRNAKDDTGASGSMTVPTETISGGSNSSPIETDNDASSSLTAPTGNCYEAFLSFRGKDTRHGFTDHLYNGLLDAGIDAFRDDDELRHGENIRPELLAAITNSKILIPILSVNYGESSWCLDELVQIMECKKNKGQIVLPIFYKVKPSDVGHQIGSFGDAFRKRERRLRKRHLCPTILEKWKQALLEVSTLKGYEADGYEGKLVKSIVQKVLSELKKEFALVIPENLVGIDGHVEKVMKFLDNNSSATLFIGIHGMGGIGKTTLAKTIYNKLSDQFNYHSFIADVRESCQRHGLEYLQNQLISDILNQKNQISNKDDGTRFISSKFKNKKVLVLLDDIDDVDQLKALAGNHNWFSSGSRILITTRKISVLDNEGVDFKYGHEVMDEKHSMVLFSRHAFLSNSPPSDFKDLAHDVITTTGGLPLSLEVLGSTLYRKKPTFWRGTIDKLKKVPHQKVREKLRISYEELDYGQKQIFLDIACFFIGTDRVITSYMWDACGFFPEEGIEALIFRSLIKIGDDHEFIMHDQLRDLGREIVREENQQEPQYRSRLWDSKEVLKVLKENKGTDKIGAINLSYFRETVERNGDIYAKIQFKNLTSLRFLHMERVQLSGNFKDPMEELRWLRWEECPVNFEFNNFHVKELAVLELSYSNINENWGGWSSFMISEKLKYLDLSFCRLLENTVFLSAFKHLEVLILNRCGRLKRIDPSIGDMKALLRLELRGCRSLMELPAEIESLENLEILVISETRIQELPKGIGRLRKLRELHASYCDNLKGELRESMGSLENLEILDISVNGIEELPKGIGRLRKLRELRAVNCSNLKGELPESMGSLENLEILAISGSGIEELPKGIGRLRKLRELHVSDCCNLKGELPESMGSLENLEILSISGSGIEELPKGIGRLRKLRELRASGCSNLKGELLESIRNLSSLRRLDFFDCRNLQSLPDLPSSLTDLIVTCQSLKLPSLSHLTHLKTLVVLRCEFLECIQVLPSTLLENSECSQPTDVEESESPQSLNTPFKLDNLRVRFCPSIKTLDVSQFIHLRTLSVADCENLLEVRGLDKLIHLESLYVKSCDSIERLLLPKSKSLKILDATWCEKLAEIRGLDRLEFLESLNITRCTSIEKLDLPKSGRLKKLEADDCKNLAKIQCLDTLKFLEELSIGGCMSLETIPKLSGTRIYRN